MTLSAEMLRLADSYYKKRCFKIDNKYRMSLIEAKVEFMRTRNHFIIHKFYLEWADEKVAARVETYIDAFKSANLIPSDGDINEIKWDLEDIILNVTEVIPVDTKAILEREKIRMIEVASHDIDIFIQETKLEQAKPVVREPQSASTVYQTNIHGPNYGNIQQGEKTTPKPQTGRSPMRISRDREQLARMQFGQRAAEISRKYAEESSHIQWMPRGGGKQAAEAKAHIARITEIAEAWVDIYLEAFAKEDLVPDNRDLKEMEDTIDQMLANRHGNDLYRPPVGSYEAIRMIPDRVKFKLRTRVKEIGA